MYITIEGVPGIYKEELLNKLRGWLNLNDYKTRQVNYGEKTIYGCMIEERLTKHEHVTNRDRTEIALLETIRKLGTWDNIEKTKESEKEVLLSTQSIYSNAAYNAWGEESRKWVLELGRYAPKPDITIYLDMSTEAAEEKLGKESKWTHEDLYRIRRNYLRLSEMKKTRIEVVQYNCPPCAYAKVKEIVSKLVGVEA